MQRMHIRTYVYVHVHVKCIYNVTNAHMYIHEYLVDVA